MFNRTYLLPASPDVHVHNNIEQKPHDAADAARLYGELEDKARREVAGATIEQLGAHNEIKIVKVATAYRADTDQRVMRVMFTINGVQHDFVCGADQGGTQLEVLRRLANAVCHEAFRSLQSDSTGAQ